MYICTTFNKYTGCQKQTR